MKYGSIGIAVLLCAIDSRADSTCGRDAASKMSIREIQQAILACSAADQVEMYLASIWRTRPPSYEVAEFLAPHGGSLLPAVVERMRTTLDSKDEEGIESLLILITEVQLAGTQIPAATLEQIDTVIALMTDPDARSGAEEEFDSIKSRSQCVRRAP